MATRRRRAAEPAPVSNRPPEKVQGIVLQHCNEALVLSTIDKLKRVAPMTRDHDGSLKDAVLVLAGWMGKHGNKDELVPCDKCNGVVDITLIDRKILPAVCPFCGEGDAEDMPQQAAEVIDMKERRRVPAASDVPEPEIVEAEGEEVESEIVEPEAGEPGESIEVASVKSVAVGDELAAVAAHIDELLLDTANNFLRIGEDLSKLVDGKLWKQETDAKGKPVFGSFEKYVKARWNMSDDSAYRMIKVFQSGATLEDVRKYGGHKLAVAYKLPDAIGKKLLKEGASVRQLERAARGTETETAPEPTTMTCKVPIKRNKVALYARPKRGKALEEGAPAKRVSDEPTGILELENGMTLHFLVRQNKKGNLEVVVEPRRAE